MGLFNPIQKKSFSETIITPTFIPVDWLNTYLAGSSSATDKKFLELYLTVPELQAVINYKATAFADMRIKAVDKEGKEKDIPQLGVFAKPNPLQSFKEFAMQYYVLRAIFGNEFIHPIFGVDPAKTTTMWNLPPMNAEIIPIENNLIVFNQTELEEIIKEYHFEFNSNTIKYQPEEIIHYNDNQIRFDDNRYLLGDSKLRPLVQSCENIKSAYEARGVLIQNSALGILSNTTKDADGTTPLLKGDKEQLQEDFNKYGLTKGKWQVIMTNASLQWQSMAVDFGKLKLYEEVDADFRAIANAYGFPPELLQPIAGASLNRGSNAEAKKQLYQDAIIPEANEWLQGLGNFFGLDNISLVADFSHIAVLQEDLKERSIAMNQAATGFDKALAAGFLEIERAKEQFEKFLI